MTDDVRETSAGAGADATPPAASTEPGTPGDAAEAPAAAPAPPGDAALAAEAAEYKDRWLRAEADIQNVRRRAQRDRDEALAATEARFLLDLVELLDDLERALGAMSPEQAGAPWAQGVAMTAQRMRDTLARWSVTTVETVGRPFDPNVHEAMLEIAPPEGVRPGHVAQEILKGYRRGERTLRPARVAVARSEG